MKILSWDVGIKNLSYCILEKDNESNIDILQWGIINLQENDELKKNRNLLFENIPRKLSELDYLLDVDKVVIENQPSLKNPQMKSIQMIVYSYFIMYGKVLSNNENKISDIDFCNASNKLKVYDGPQIILVKKNRKKSSNDSNINDFSIIENNNHVDEVEVVEKSKKKSTKLSYTDKKKMAIEHVKYFLKNDETNLDFFNKHKKKDDLADSYLQGLYMLNVKKK
tara:strand:+ start:623 stop:1294 length:672 start_codon:yes stop_codon:yes gene_type:complete